jgi:hypothetical protein
VRSPRWGGCLPAVIFREGRGSSDGRRRSGVRQQLEKVKKQVKQGSNRRENGIDPYGAALTGVERSGEDNFQIRPTAGFSGSQNLPRRCRKRERQLCARRTRKGRSEGGTHRRDTAAAERSSLGGFRSGKGEKERGRSRVVGTLLCGVLPVR